MQSGTSTSSGAGPENQIYMPSDTNLFFLLKGDHPTLPGAEVKAIMEAEGVRYASKPGAPQVLRCQAEPESSRAVANRAYYTRLCAGELSVSRDNPEAALSALRDVDFRKQLKPGECFNVSLRRVRRSTPDVDLHSFRHRIIRLIQNQTRSELHLDRPDVKFIGVFSRGIFYFGRVFAEAARRFGDRRARRRPFFHPSTLQPKLAGCMVNLTRIRPPESLLDPFCGAGAILIEAAVLGCHPIGMDLSSLMVEGSRKNLIHFGVGPYDLVAGDARRLPLQEVGAIATDPPYGRIASTHGVFVKELYQGFLCGAADLLSDGGYLCIAAPHVLQVSELAREAGFKHYESHLIPVHDSLIREVAVFRRM